MSMIPPDKFDEKTFWFIVEIRNRREVDTINCNFLANLNAKKSQKVDLCLFCSICYLQKRENVANSMLSSDAIIKINDDIKNFNLK